MASRLKRIKVIREWYTKDYNSFYIGYEKSVMCPYFIKFIGSDDEILQVQKDIEAGKFYPSVTGAAEKHYGCQAGKAELELLGEEAIKLAKDGLIALMGNTSDRAKWKRIDFINLLEKAKALV